MRTKRNNNTPCVAELLTRKEAAMALRMDNKYFKNFVEMYKIPFQIRGVKKFYRVEALNAAILAKEAEDMRSQGAIAL